MNRRTKAGAAHKSVTIRKYPNRRYYDVTNSQHVTLQQIYRLVCSGQDIEVTDSKTGADITSKVLTQVILEHDVLKLDVFSAELLHQVIRASEPLVRDFVEKYFNQAFLAFSRSQEQFAEFLRQSLGLDAAQSPAAVWQRMLLGSFPPGLLPPGRPGEANPLESPAPSRDDLKEQVDQLREQIVNLQQQLQKHRP